MPLIALLILAGCSKSGPVPDPTYPTATATDTGPAGWTALAPTVRLLGPKGMDFMFSAAPVAADAGAPGALLLEAYDVCPDTGPCPEAILLGGDIEPGVHDVLDLWDGVSTYDADLPPFDGVIPAGDVDDDGHLDFWLHDTLHLGPLLGRELRHGHGHATVSHLDEMPVAAGFDADGDGHEDMATYPGGQTALVYFGPFEGVVPTVLGGDVDPGQVTWYGSGTGPFTLEVVWMFEDHLGPGRHVIGVGAAAVGVDTFFYELQQPRGARLGFEDAIATHDGGLSSDAVKPLLDPGDLNGDGHPDVIRHTTFAYAGPVEGEFAEDYPNTWPRAVEFVNGAPLYPMGDLNGDGVQEILGAYWTSLDGPSWYVIAFSPYDAVIDLAHALPLTHDGTSFTLGATQGDIDGDGLPDLIDTPSMTEVTIWYGKDLLAAWEALQASR